MKRQQIQSSTIRTAGYEWDGAKGTGTLEIEFSSTAVYRYANVPQEVWKAFLATDSKGGYFVARIRDRFKFECVYRPPRKDKSNAVETKQEDSHGQPNREKTNGTKDKEVPSKAHPEARTKENKARIS